MDSLPLLSVSLGTLSSVAIMAPAIAESDLFLAYPPLEHQTTSDRIFLIGTADPTRPVFVNGEPIENRSDSGHFAPTVPLEMGVNALTLTQGEDSIDLTVTRVPATPVVPPEIGYRVDSLTPQVAISKPAGELVCFSAIALPDVNISVDWADQTIPLTPALQANLPPNSAVLVANNEPLAQTATTYEGCLPMPAFDVADQPTYTVNFAGNETTHTLAAPVTHLPITPFQIAEVVVDSGIARTGPSTSYSRITPLPLGTRAAITAVEGDWLRLDYGGWIRAAETVMAVAAAPPQATIRSVTSQQLEGWTEIRFPLTATVPISIDQTANTLSLTLHNTTPQTDTIYFDVDPIVERMDWLPVLPDKALYRFQFKTSQQWGYKVRYEGTTLVLSLRHPPQLAIDSLAGSTILIDPGHGSEHDLGARGPNGYPEKDVNLVVSKLLRDALEARGATVVMTREGDEDLFPRDRVDIINAVEPTLALSVHYNALPDAGDALNTAGIGMFWYNAQAHSLSEFLHDYLVSELNRPSYGVYWNNLALTRPTVAPSVLLELGFMINPYEFEWITAPAAQVELAEALADAIALWMQDATQQP